MGGNLETLEKSCFSHTLYILGNLKNIVKKKGEMSLVAPHWEVTTISTMSALCPLAASVSFFF